MLPLRQVVADGEEGVIVVFLRRHLQVQSGDNPGRAGQEGERGQVRSKGGRQGERLDKWSSPNRPFYAVFTLLPLRSLSHLLFSVAILSSRFRLSSVSAHR